MALPERIRVKLSSEAAEAISITPVVVQEIAVRELVEHMLGFTGKDPARVREILARGTLVSGASRFRWAACEADLASIGELLATFPEADPSRIFDPRRCVRAVLRGGRHAIEIPRAAGERTRLFRRGSFWGALMTAVAAGPIEYSGYSYRDRADRYVAHFAAHTASELQSASGSLAYSSLRDQVSTIAFLSAELFVERE